jgi:hypothetical protein
VVEAVLVTNDFWIKITEPYPVGIRSLSGRFEAPNDFLCEYKDRDSESTGLFDVFISRACGGDGPGTVQVCSGLSGMMRVPERPEILSATWAFAGRGDDGR